MIGPLKRPAYLDGYEGRWVAVLDDRVIAAAISSTALASILSNMRDRGKSVSNAVVQYVFPPSDTITMY